MLTVGDISAWWVLVILPTAFFLDRLIGDPVNLPHPVRWMGQAISFCEPRFRAVCKHELPAGTLFAITLICATFVVCTALVHAASSIHPVIGLILQVIMVFYSLAARSLGQAAEEIYLSLKEGRVELARTQVAMIVGRDVTSYGADDIARATVETVAENYVDGVFSPLVFAAVGGGPLALTYKMINTLDSMVGYKNERYLHFGRAAAKIDDAANYIPARLSILFIGAAAHFLPALNGPQALGLAVSEGARHSSPNAGYPEAAFAGALEVRLNGPNYYGGQLVKKPFIGSRFSSPGVEDIRRSCTLMLGASLLSCVTAWMITVLVLLVSLP
ncbi:MAG: cobalamin biosynthesis protein CobD [Desulfobulbus propionicus]|nr:MAG: cobalamin biosynthesis protein CobD [Desulfobulbus propionicus]